MLGNQSRTDRERLKWWRQRPEASRKRETEKAATVSGSMSFPGALPLCFSLSSLLLLVLRAGIVLPTHCVRESGRKERSPPLRTSIGPDSEDPRQGRKPSGIDLS